MTLPASARFQHRKRALRKGFVKKVQRQHRTMGTAGFGGAFAPLCGAAQRKNCHCEPVTDVSGAAIPPISRAGIRRFSLLTGGFPRHLSALARNGSSFIWALRPEGDNPSVFFTPECTWLSTCRRAFFPQRSRRGRPSPPPWRSTRPRPPCPAARTESRR